MILGGIYVEKINGQQWVDDGGFCTLCNQPIQQAQFFLEEGNLFLPTTVEQSSNQIDGFLPKETPHTPDERIKEIRGFSVATTNQVKQPEESKTRILTPKKLNPVIKEPTIEEEQRLPAVQPPPVGEGPIPSTSRTTNQRNKNESLFEHTLRLNRGKQVEVHMNFDNTAHFDEVFIGKLITGDKDCLIIEEKHSGKRLVLLLAFLNFIKIDT